MTKKSVLISQFLVLTCTHTHYPINHPITESFECINVLNWRREKRINFMKFAIYAFPHQPFRPALSIINGKVSTFGKKFCGSVQKTRECNFIISESSHINFSIAWVGIQLSRCIFGIINSAILLSHHQHTVLSWKCFNGSRLCVLTGWEGDGDTIIIFVIKGETFHASLSGFDNWFRSPGFEASVGRSGY